MVFQEGEVVGPYRILHKLGQGGMATVFKAYHASLDRYVAIKILHTALMQDPNFLARFDREAKVVANLDHPNIIPIYDFAEHNGSPYFVMKFVEGDTLKAYLKSKPLTQADGLRIIETVGLALAYAHKQGILHRDIKPSNVMISNEDNIYLTDFGLARIASAGESTLSSDMMLGTPQYISPEQAMGKSELDERTDIYSFGVLVYELVVGKVPFNADTPYSIVHDHIYSALPLPRSVNPKVPESVERVILKALAKDRDDRFSDVNSFIAAFKAASQGDDMPAHWLQSGAAIPAAAATPSSAVATNADTLDDSRPTLAPTNSKVASAAKPKNKFRWWYLVPLLVGLFIILNIVGNVLDNRQNRNVAAATDRVNLGEAGDFEEDDKVFDNNQPDQPSVGFPGDDEVVDGSIEAAQINVEENPQDPLAYLDLVEAFLDEGYEEEAKEYYKEAEDLAGENSEFYLLAAGVFRQYDLWPQAFEATLKAIVFTQGPPPPREVVNSLHQAAYHTAAFDSFFAEEILFSELVFNNERRIGPIEGIFAAQARFLLYDGEIEEAERLINQIMNLGRDLPGSPVADLVYAEILFELGEIDEALKILRELANSNRPNVDFWVRIEAQKLLNEFKL